MKSIPLAMFALMFSLSGLAARAADEIVGKATLNVYDHAEPFMTSNEIDDTGTQLSEAGDAKSLLAKVPGGFQGHFLGRDWDVTCSASGCGGGGSTPVDLVLTEIEGGYRLDGEVDGFSTSLSVTDAEIDLSVQDMDQTSYRLNRESDGSYSGLGAWRRYGYESFLSLDYSASGSLADALKDPATAIVVLLPLFVR